MSTLPPMARRPDRKRGVTLIEAVLFISIALGLIVGGLIFFQQANLSSRVNSAVRTVTAAVSEIRAMHLSVPTFDGLTAATLIFSGGVPASIMVDTTDPLDGVPDELRNEWDGEILVFAADVQSTVVADDDGFAIVYREVPVAACTRLSAFDANGDGILGTGIMHFRAGNDAAGAVAWDVDEVDVGDADHELQADGALTPAAAATACSAADTDNNGLVDFMIAFRR